MRYQMEGTTGIGFLQLVYGGLVSGSIYILVALGLGLIFGVMRIFNFAQADMGMICAYVAYSLVVRQGLDYFLSLIIIIFFAAFFGFATERFIFRPVTNAPSFNAVIVSIGFLIFLENLASAIWSPNPKFIKTPLEQIVLNFGVVTTNMQRLAVLGGTIVVAIALHLVLTKTMLGKCIRAVSDDSESASLTGINTSLIVMLTWAIACILSGIGAVLLVPLLVLTPWMGVSILLKACAVVILGGMGSILGMIIAGFVVGLIEVFSCALISTTYVDTAAFIVLIIALIVRPYGLVRERVEENI